MPCTSTCWPTTKCLAVMLVPMGSSASSVTRKSRRYRFSGRPWLSNCPARAAETRLRFCQPPPSCRAVTPSLSVVRTAVTCKSCSSTTVSGIIWPSASHACVIPHFMPSAPHRALFRAGSRHTVSSESENGEAPTMELRRRVPKLPIRRSIMRALRGGENERRDSAKRTRQGADRAW
eukprot:scaffold82940_cov58-Phaeocystis_antarctica.AAC.2